VIFLDTNACLSVLKGNEGVRTVLDEFHQRLAITTHVLFEIHSVTAYFQKKGILDPEVKYLGQLTKFKLYGFDKLAALKAADIWATLKCSGEMIKVMDILIGAVVLRHKCTDILSNDGHFTKIPGLNVHTYVN